MPYGALLTLQPGLSSGSLILALLQHASVRVSEVFDQSLQRDLAANVSKIGVRPLEERLQSAPIRDSFDRTR